MRTSIKICGVTSVADAEACLEAGADWIGVNLVPESPRAVDLATAREIAGAVGKDRAVAVVADRSVGELLELRRVTGIAWLQLHGAEPPQLLSELLPHAFKAIGIATSADVAIAASFPGEEILLDTRVSGLRGGTGQTFDWPLVTRLARSRRVTLAGGLRPENVEDAIRTVRPFRVDVASGVERKDAPRHKDIGQVQAFVEAVRHADTT